MNDGKPGGIVYDLDYKTAWEPAQRSTPANPPSHTRSMRRLMWTMFVLAVIFLPFPPLAGIFLIIGIFAGIESEGPLVFNVRIVDDREPSSKSDAWHPKR
jgi:hypothetical protein